MDEGSWLFPGSLECRSHCEQSEGPLSRSWRAVGEERLVLFSRVWGKGVTGAQECKSTWLWRITDRPGSAVSG